MTFNDFSKYADMELHVSEHGMTNVWIVNNDGTGRPIQLVLNSYREYPTTLKDNGLTLVAYVDMEGYKDEVRN